MSYKILIVEDDAVIAEEIAHHLARWNLETAIVKDFSQVMTEFTNQSPSLVLLDISLPCYNGY